MSKRNKNTFALTTDQHDWLAEACAKTGLLKVEIVRRAIDFYRECEEAKEERKFFTPEQRKEINEIARAKGVTELSIIRRAIDRELNRFFRRY